MKLHTIIAIVLSFNLYAQEEDPAINIQDAAILASHINEINNLNQDPCFTPQVKIEVPASSETTCSFEQKDIEKIKDYKVIAVQYDKHEDLPENLKKHIPGKSFETGNGGVKLIFAGKNDNIFYGLWGHVIGYDHDGDDRGYTHNMEIGLEKTTKKNLTWSTSLSTDLYTVKHGEKKYDEKDKSMYPVFFENINKVKLNLNNIQQDKLWYYKAGVGFVTTNSNKVKGIFNGSGQQNTWHALSEYKFDYLKDGRPSQLGIEAEMIVGLNLISRMGGNCRIRTNIGLGGTYSSLGHNLFGPEVNMNFFKQKPDSNKVMVIGLSAKNQFHKISTTQTGNMTSLGASFGLGGKLLYVEAGITGRMGDLPNFSKYDMDKDPLGTVKAVVFLGTGEAKKKKTSKETKELKPVFKNWIN